MHRFSVFLIRAVLGVMFAILLVRMFYPQKPIGYSIGLAAFMVGMAYYFEYIKKHRDG
ncbi:MAG: hypothetical protein ACOZF0_10995 [Thermodesulfobacteriota bacterium]